MGGLAKLARCENGRLRLPAILVVGRGQCEVRVEGCDCACNGV